MKFQIHPTKDQIDHLTIQRALLAVDDSVLIKLDPFAGRLHITGRLDESEAIQALRGVGYPIEPITSNDCCGGCS